MQIQVNTDDNIQGVDTLTATIEEQVRRALSPFAEQITRVEVHLSDENAQKTGSADKRCLLEVRPSGKNPIAVTHQAASVQDSCAGAVQKMLRKLRSIVGSQSRTKGGQSIRTMDGI